MASWPATGNVTTQPLPVVDDIQRIVDNDNGDVVIRWQPNPDSEQDNYKVRSTCQGVMPSGASKRSCADERRHSRDPVCHISTQAQLPG